MRALLDALAEPGTCVTIDQLPGLLGKSYRDACTDLRRAYAAGLIERASEGCYRLTERGRSEDVEPLMVITAPTCVGGAWDATERTRIWAAMRQLGRFCRADLAAAVAQPDSDRRALESSTRRYIAQLVAAGYLVPLTGRVRVAAHPNTGQKRYRLVRDTGPTSPLVRRDGSIFDRNLGRVVTANVQAD
ncbi:hypothetical protein FFK22_024540 [Mycobacterium sp. KBS0706]|uniref:hypothetical protein n=1 Tax=Mycobacterium sp. KBS0706 TaxID=2578109 RepID=UPI00110F9D5B|nr:hypothetical protein [Mycobacterium sp. KBS0706]TSD85992.1 hypothetical protein FFK22_024540 [Mycobacterium sp. KBS0706]